jgi:iron complex outermembrane receptor protein
MARTTRRGFLVDTTVLLVSWLMSISSLAGDIAGPPTEHAIGIARGPLLTAIRTLATQAHVSIDTNAIEPNQIEAGPVNGRFSVDEALRQLLEGTPYIGTQTDWRTYVIVRAPQVHGPSLPKDNVSDERATGRNDMIVRGTRIGAEIDEEILASARATFDTDSLDRSGQAAAGGLLLDMPGQLHALPESVWGDGAQYADLRGLGVDHTTVSINGRRVSPAATSSVAFDLNNISLTAVDRVDVLHDADAAALGARALGGVLNFKLKRADQTPKARIEYGSAAGGGEQRQVSVSAGSWGTRLIAGLVVDYFERSELPGAAREFSRHQDFRRYGGSDARSLSSWPGNIYSTTGLPLPGLQYPFAAVPVGTGDGDPSISDFYNTDGQYTRESLRRYSSILPETGRLSVVANAEYSFKRVTAFVDVLGVWRHTDYQFMPPTLTGEIVPASNAFNDFGESVYVSRLLLEIDPRRVVTDSRFLHAVAGLRGQFRSWSWEFSALRSEETASRWANNALDAERVASALAASDPNLALNVFQDGPVGSPELVASLLAPPSSADFRSLGSEVAATFRGSVMTLPAGEMQASFSAHWHEETTTSTRTVAIGHARLFVPLLDQLDADLSLRGDQFSDLGSILTTGYALKWQPSQSLRVRAFYGTGFRAPSTYELSGPRYQLQLPVVDQRRNGEVRHVTAFIGSSKDIEPVTGESTAVTVTFTPSDDLQLEANWWVKHVYSRIMSVPLSIVLEHEDVFGSAIVRDAPTAADIAADLPGVLRSVDITTTNVGGIEASGIDAKFSFRFHEHWSAELSTTWVDEFVTYDIPGEPPTNRVGFANPRGTIARWRALAKFDWQNEFASARLSARYVAPYEDMNGDRRAGRRLHSQTSVDVQGALDLGTLASGVAGLRGVKVTLGVLNIFDVPPQWAFAGQELGYDPSSTDPRQRYGYVRLEKWF